MPEVGAHIGGIALCGVGHMGLDAEELGEPVVIDEQTFVQFFIADQHNLEVQGQRLGIDALGADGRIRAFAGIFNAGHIGAQGAQQALPGIGML